MHSSTASGELGCPLCTGHAIDHYHRDGHRDYWQCRDCALVFVDKAQHLDERAEKAVYDCHRNSPMDAGYRRFLSRLFTPLAERLPARAEGLDFGCGPGPTLSIMFEEAGHSMALFDIYYAPDRGVLQRRYDFITATEVVEHLAAPGEVLAALVERLRPGGWLGLMTKRVTTPNAFADWHYIRDPTHVSFFSEASFHWLAARLNLEPTFCGADVVLLQKR